MITGKHLRRYRYFCNYKQAYIAAKMNISVRTYRKIENEEIPLTPERKALALKALHTTEQTLLQLEEHASGILDVATPTADVEWFVRALKEKETQIRQKEEEIRLLKHQLDRACT